MLTTTFLLSCVYSSIKQKGLATKLTTLNLYLHYIEYTTDASCSHHPRSTMWPNYYLGNTAEISLWGRDVVFCWSAAHLNENTKCRQLLNGFPQESCRQRIKLKLKANTVNLAFKLGSPFGEFLFHNIYFARTKPNLHSMRNSSFRER